MLETIYASLADAKNGRVMISDKVSMQLDTTKVGREITTIE